MASCDGARPHAMACVFILGVFCLAPAAAHITTVCSATAPSVPGKAWFIFGTYHSLASPDGQVIIRKPNGEAFIGSWDASRCESNAAYGSSGPPPPSPMPPSSASGDSTCQDGCSHSADGDCDDGGAGSEYGSCSYGTDCTDCGPRSVAGRRLWGRSPSVAQKCPGDDILEMCTQLPSDTKITCYNGADPNSLNSVEDGGCDAFPQTSGTLSATKANYIAEIDGATSGDYKVTQSTTDFDSTPRD